ncbi:proline-rich receptor-like protein kinase PERK2 [Setaria italica]|uniref:proline-rich receptor-like protein kinase PERK2 n=1 Tax=Setaria italica TaxID=4555 RepID=UPI0006467482|nr:proline-rich receptor-like protein kinase PERK2 [Setaria italica]
MGAVVSSSFKAHLHPPLLPSASSTSTPPGGNRAVAHRPPLPLDPALPSPCRRDPAPPDRWCSHAVSSLPPANPSPPSGLHTAPDPSSSMAIGLGAPTPSNPEGASDDGCCCCGGSDGKPADAATGRRGAASVAVKGRRKRGAVAEMEGNILEERTRT